MCLCTNETHIHTHTTATTYGYMCLLFFCEVLHQHVTVHCFAFIAGEKYNRNNKYALVWEWSLQQINVKLCLCVCIWRQTSYWKCGFSCNLKMWKASSLSPKCERSSVQRAPFNVRTWRSGNKQLFCTNRGVKNRKTKKEKLCWFSDGIDYSPH